MVCTSEHLIQKLGQCNFAGTHLASQEQSCIIVYRILFISFLNLVPCQRESLVDAIVVDELDLESPIRVEGQSAPREHQVDLELVGWGWGDAQLSTIIVRNLRWLIDTYRRRARSPWSKGRGFPVQAKGCCSIQAPHTRPPWKKDFTIWIKNHLGSPQSCK